MKEQTRLRLLPSQPDHRVKCSKCRTWMRRVPTSGTPRRRRSGEGSHLCELCPLVEEGEALAMRSLSRVRAWMAASPDNTDRGRDSYRRAMAQCMAGEFDKAAEILEKIVRVAEATTLGPFRILKGRVG